MVYSRLRRWRSTCWKRASSFRSSSSSFSLFSSCSTCEQYVGKVHMRSDTGVSYVSTSSSCWTYQVVQQVLKLAE